MTTDKVETAEAAAVQLFQQAAPLDPARHQDLKLDRSVGFAFARTQTAVPIVATEFAMAARDLPIVFAGEGRLPMAVLGIRSGENLLVGDDGALVAGRYVPAHLRRYPFILQEDEAQQRFALCIDEAAPHFQSQDKGEPLFNDAGATPLVTEMLQFLGEIQGGFAQTQAYAAALVAADLLIERSAVVELTSGERVTLEGFFVVDEEKFSRLPIETLAEWAQKGWLPLTYFHLQSRLNWTHLVDLAV